MNTILNDIKNAEKPVIRILRKTDDFKTFAIGLNKGAMLKNHTAPGRTKLLVLHGTIEYKTDNRSIILNKFDEFDIPLEEVHQVTGMEEAVFMLIVG